MLTCKKKENFTKDIKMLKRSRKGIDHLYFINEMVTYPYTEEREVINREYN